MKRLFRLTYFILISATLVGQNSRVSTEHIEWEYQKEANSSFDGAIYPAESGHLPVFFKSFPLEAPRNTEVTLSGKVFETFQGDLSEDQKALIGSEVKISTQLGRARNESTCQLYLLPFRNVNGTIERLLDFKLNLNFTNVPAFKSSDLIYTEQSVLSQGTFFKFQVSQDGIHKIDQGFLESLGVGASGFDIKDVRIFGMPGGMLPQVAGERLYDDLVEVAIDRKDRNGNGSFDSDDFLLFYAEGPDKWNYDAENDQYNYEKNFYDKYHYYFLSIDSGQGLDLPTATSSADATYTSNSFDGLVHHEEEQNFYLLSGRNWLGEIFQPNQTESFTELLPNVIQSEEVKMFSQVGGRTVTAGARNRFVFSINGQELETTETSKVTEGYEQPYLRAVESAASFNLSSEVLNLDLRYTNIGASDGRGWLDYYTLNARRALSFENAALEGGQQIWSDARSVGPGNVTRFEIENSDNVEIWDVTYFDAIKKVALENGGFTMPTNDLKKFIAFNNENHFVPVAIGLVENQNLHIADYPDYVIATVAPFVSEAERLADFHRGNGLRVKVVLMEQVYNEFASGSQDISALRDYMKMHFDRADGNADLAPQYLLLMGDASYDFKGIHNPENNTNLVPTYESEESFDPADSYCSDDYFAFLDDGEDIEASGIGWGSNAGAGLGLDIAIGRFPITSPEQATDLVDKILHYKSQASRGPYLNNLTFIADDEDGNLHLDDTEKHVSIVENNYSNYNVDKIYFDAFQQVPTANGNTYPGVTTALNNKVFSGSFLLNYVGHGSENGWAHEGVLDIPMIKSWTNKDQMPLFVTATCSFSRFDDPRHVSAGEELFLSADGGAIAVVTTVRLVYTNANEAMNRNFLENLFEKDNGKPVALGEILRRGKSATAQDENNRKFALLGDPALVLNYPEYDVVTTHLNDQPIESASLDTLKALSKITIQGEVRDGGNLLEDFNGTITPLAFDKRLSFSTLGQDERSQVTDYDLRKSIVFKGKASVVNGKFQFSFVVPRDIAFQVGNAKLSYYAQSGDRDAAGYNTDVLVGGVNENPPEDDLGPNIEIFLNDDSFVFGGVSNDDPVVLLKMKDDSGINTTGTGVGHDVIINLNSDQSDIVVNDYYKSAEDNYQEGLVSYPLFDLPEGRHTISARAWDVYNNPGEGYTEFVIEKSAEMALRRVLNYPNPFIDNTSFWFEHNKVGQNLKVNIQIFTATGRLVKTISQTVTGAATRVSDISWNGRDEYGNKIGRGVYIYRIAVYSENGQESAEAIEKLVILK